MALDTGTKLGPYEIQSSLGAGGMGEVYRARDSKLGRDVALKVLPSDMAADPDRLARFQREARAVAGVPDIGLQQLSVSVDYRFVQSPSGNLAFWLPDKIATYWDYDAHRIILDHGFFDFQFFSVETQERTREPKNPNR